MTVEITVLIALFWQCEVEYLQGLRAPEDMRECIAIADEIKQRKFSGDFQAYLQWWRENRDREYSKRGFRLD